VFTVEFKPLSNCLIIPQIKMKKHELAAHKSGQVAPTLLVAQAQGRGSQPDEVEIVLSIGCSTTYNFVNSAHASSESICITLPVVSAMQTVTQ